MGKISTAPVDLNNTKVILGSTNWPCHKGGQPDFPVRDRDNGRLDFVHAFGSLVDSSSCVKLTGAFYSVFRENNKFNLVSGVQGLILSIL